MGNEYGYRSDIEIWRDFKKGNKEAFDHVYNNFYFILYNYGIKLSKDKDIVKDCIQNLFIELWRNKENLSDTNSIKFYLFKGLRRKIVNELINNRKLIHDDVYDESDFEIILPHEYYLIEEQTAQEQKEKLLEGLNKLSKRQKEAIFLRFYDNLSYEEIASVMSLNIKSVYNLISKAVDALKKNIHCFNALLIISHLI